MLPYKLELIDRAETLTAYAALPLMLETLRAVYRPRHYRPLAEALGYESWKVCRRHLESIVLLIASGGEHLSDLDMLRADRGLRAMVGFGLSSPTQAKDFLYRFHQNEDGSRITPAQDDELSKKGASRIRAEGPGLLALAKLAGRIPASLQHIRLCHRATLDIDATIIEAHKQRALCAYEGTVGYQPQLAYGAEQGTFILDEFRDGIVPAAFEARALLKKCFAALPPTVTSRRLRTDSALYDEQALTWADDEGIEFCCSADMSKALAACIEQIPEAEWKPYRSLKEKSSQDGHAELGEERQWAEVYNFVPGWNRNRKKDGQAFRYIAIRVRSRQTDLPLEGPAAPAPTSTWRCFAVVTNMDWDGEKLLNWHREKQGTVEHGHGVLKNDLAGGVLPAGRFGSNAAWWRINVLAHNLHVLLKVAALPQDLATARPKTLRFRVFCVAGRVVRHARQWILKLSRQLPWADAYVVAREALVALATSLHPVPT